MPMPETMCRRCGAELAEHANCNLCGRALRVICPVCGFLPDDRVHADCLTAASLLSSALAP